MKLLLNNKEIETSVDSISLSQLLSNNYETLRGMAVAVNNKLVSRDKWDRTKLNPMDDVVVITAAFGG
ncbi:MAG: sulfur carrier protein ThiS [Bacteroides sp.]|nr:sulfur carrier protein ThiS [Bacteroidales bacterium]MBD5283108.1 sulfur carrier protein ThiS [Bacteroides sp.]MBD5337069.1 sulfur carrier protein ThiS [Bacteroides sp.]